VIGSVLDEPVFVTTPPSDARLTPFLDLSAQVDTGNVEQGLLGLAFDPQYDATGLFYVSYTDTAGDTRVMRYRVSADADVADA
jgi:hypothetical protein